MLVSAISAADEAFSVLVAQPAPLSLDARGIPGLPQRHLGLDELRDLFLTRAVPVTTSDAVWRRLGMATREWGPPWVVGAVGVALPGLTRLARRLAIHRPGLVEDIDSEVITGFLHDLRHADLNPPQVWLRLMWAAWRAGNRARQVEDTTELPPDLPYGSRTPRAPYGHPDLVLGRAVVAGVLTDYEAALIGDTRLGEVLIDVLAQEQGTTAQILRMRRQRAERALVAAMDRGQLSGPLRTPDWVRDRNAQARLDGITAQTSPTGTIGTIRTVRD